MSGPAELWLPILLSVVLVFIASSLIHMLLPWHKNDYPRLPNEDAVMEALRPLAIPPGDYMMPRPTSREQMRSPEFAERMKRGPVMMLTVMPNGPGSMGRNLVLWFVYCAVVTLIAAIVAWRVLPVVPSHRVVFRLVGVMAFVGYAAALWQLSIWYRRAWSLTIKATIDGVIYALITAFTFAHLWPR
ncbi:MAG: hypothetical protein M3068_06630 [Gemmatimonadota bacterium]|nr:hypothetical protein [Gemmatimonadota bacterium]